MQARGWFIALLLSLVVTVGSASEKNALEVLKGAYNYLGSLEKYAFEAVVVHEATNRDDTLINYKDRVKVKVSRPDNLWVDIKGNDRERTNYLHNGIYTMVDHIFGFYGEINTSMGIDGSLEYILNHFGINAPLSALVFSDMNKRINIKKSRYFGTKEVLGVECDYVAFRTKKREVHVWIATGERPLVQAFSVFDRDIKGKPRVNTTLSWKLDGKIKESDFIFVAPKEVLKIGVESAR
jgi:hypothetical protein